MKRKKRQRATQENPFWLSISDLMSVLMLLFILFTAAALVQLSENTIQSKIFALLVKELKQVKIKVEINPEHGTISIADRILFNTGDDVLKEEGIQFLEKFIPILINVLFYSDEIASEIVSVDIEGYTSQNFVDTGFRREMMALSLGRARNVWNFVNEYERLPHKEKFLKKLKVCGWGNLKATSDLDDPMDRKVIFQLQFKGRLEKLKETLLKLGSR